MIDVFENPDYIFIVLQLLQGGDLYDYFRKRDFSVSEERSKVIFRKIANALYYMHSMGICHRDLKLENIMMTDDSEEAIPVIIDFGLSKMIGPNQMITDKFGTVGYTAPEIYTSKSYDKKVDLFSLGVILYALLSGYLPFDDPEEAEVIRKTVKSPVSFEPPKFKTVSEEAKEFVLKLLDKDKKKRISIEETVEHPWS
jgi:serine/threonine protein kinase